MTPDEDVTPNEVERLNAHIEDERRLRDAAEPGSPEHREAQDAINTAIARVRELQQADTDRAAREERRRVFRGAITGVVVGVLIMLGAEGFGLKVTGAVIAGISAAIAYTRFR